MRLSYNAVAQIFNLLYRRLAVGGAFVVWWTVKIFGRPQNTILRYSRLKICATSRADSSYILFVVLVGLLAAFVWDAGGASALKPDITVAADGSGDFKTIQQAVASIPPDNRERKNVLIKNGVYKEKIRVEASFVTLRGESREGTRVEFSQLNDDFVKNPDALGTAVINLGKANDFVLENLTVENTAGQVGPHAFTIFSKGDRTVIVDCNVLSHGADTVSLWLENSGRYYHARCKFQGSVDFVCPRGWCYVTDCTFYEMKATAAVWHDGHADKDMKFVMRNCKFDGVDGWNLARHHRDAQFYFLGCKFSKTMIDKAPFRVIYPDDPKRNADYDKMNLWGERAYFYNCHRDGGDYSWHQDNLSAAPGAPSAKDITAAWTFAGKWDPERQAGPTVRRVTVEDGQIALKFSEAVTVKGKPRLVLSDKGSAEYTSGSGSDTLTFTQGKNNKSKVDAVELSGGAIIASEAAAQIRAAELALPRAE